MQFSTVHFLASISTQGNPSDIGSRSTTLLLRSTTLLLLVLLRSSSLRRKLLHEVS